jgi:predicted amidohydrolase
MRVAVAQFASGEDKARNRSVAAELIRRASSEGAALVVLPEASLHTFGTPTTDLASAAEPLDGPFVTSLVEAAADEIVVVAGTFEVAPRSTRVFNTVVVVGHDQLLASYRKVHLYDALGWRESDRVEAGDPTSSRTPVSVGEFNVGVMTCFDLRFPESARVAVDGGADLLAVPAAWVAGPGKEEQWDVLLRARAIENTIFVLGADQPEPTYSGRSAIVDPSGAVLVRLDARADGGRDGRSAGLAITDIDRAALEERRSSMPLLSSRRYEVRPA